MKSASESVDSESPRLEPDRNLAPRTQPMTRSSLTPPARAADLTPSLGRRMACFVYEGVLLFGIVFVSALLFAVLTDQRHALHGRDALQLTALVLAPGVYLVGYWSQTGRTLPMQTWHIRLVTEQGARVSRLRASARYLASWVWFLPALALWHFAGWHSASSLAAALITGVAAYALLALAHPQGQFWHDALCCTRLVDTRGPSGEQGDRAAAA
jgi:uncharacterized RDD family membrane protein YckC